MFARIDTPRSFFKNQQHGRPKPPDLKKICVHAGGVWYILKIFIL